MDKIRKNEEFQIIYNNGKSYFGYYSLVYIKKNNLEKSRIGVVASKKIGNAIVRARIKRIFREYFRINNEKIKLGYDIIFIGKKNFGNNIKTLKYIDIEKDLNKIIKKTEVLI